MASKRTNHPITLDRIGERTLQLSTHKDTRGKLSTTATVLKEDGQGGFSMVLFADFMQTVARTDQRATAGAVERQHADVLARLDNVLNDVRAHYAAKDPAEVA